jgi:alkylhydroperoxidase family enzyme
VARISLDPPPTLSYRIAQFFIRRRFGDMLDPFRAMAHNMPVAQAIGKLEQSAGGWKKLDVQLRDLADLAAAVKIGCPWCMDFGYWVLNGHGIPREKIEAVPHWRGSQVFNPLERLVLEYAEAMTETPPTVSDDVVARLRGHLDESQFVELTMIVCLENLRSRFNSAVGLARQGFKERCEIRR